MKKFFRSIRYFDFNSKLLRSLLSLYFKEGKSYRVFLGPLKGAKLFYTPSINFHAIVGVWELESFTFLKKVLKKTNLLRKDAVIADIGSNIGLFSLWFSRLIRPLGGKIFAFEPAPETLSILRKNLALNPSPEIEVIEQACSDKSGTVEFFIGEHHHMSSLVESWAGDSKIIPEKVVVPTTTLDKFFADENSPHPDFIKMDIEGGGVYALKGCDECITRKRPLIWFESHTPEEDRAVSDLLLKHKYQAYRMSNHKSVQNRTTTYPDPEGVWGIMLLYPEEKHAELVELF